MTHDQLVQFAASKVGGEARLDGDGSLVVHMIEAIGLDDEWCESEVWYYLTSPDLMLKGMGVCPYDVTVHSTNDAETRYMYMHNPRQAGGHIEFYDNPADISLTFWTCWYKLEKGD